MKKINTLIIAIIAFALTQIPVMADVAYPPYYPRRSGVSGFLIVLILAGVALAAAILIYFGIKGKRR